MATNKPIETINNFLLLYGMLHDFLLAAKAEVKQLLFGFW